MSPAKLAVTGSDAAGWLTGMMTQLAEPEASVVAVQLWAVVPEPSVNVTSLPGSAAPLVVRVPDRVAVWPLTTDVVPVYTMAVGSGVTTKVLAPLLGNQLGEALASPTKVPVNG